MFPFYFMQRTTTYTKTRYALDKFTQYAIVCKSQTEVDNFKQA